MRNILIIIIFIIGGIYFIENYYRDWEMVCIDKRIVKWIGVCNRYAECVVGFTDGSIGKRFKEPYIGEERCLEHEFKNMRVLK